MCSKFETTVVQEDDAIVIYVNGEVDIAACERLRDVIEPNMGPRQTIVLDLSGSRVHGLVVTSLSSCRPEVF